MVLAAPFIPDAPRPRRQQHQRSVTEPRQLSGQNQATRPQQPLGQLRTPQKLQELYILGQAYYNRNRA
jgi:hypothetical protein